MCLFFLFYLYSVVIIATSDVSKNKHILLLYSVWYLANSLMLKLETSYEMLLFYSIIKTFLESSKYSTYIENMVNFDFWILPQKIVTPSNLIKRSLYDHAIKQNHSNCYNLHWLIGNWPSKYLSVLQLFAYWVVKFCWNESETNTWHT